MTSRKSSDIVYILCGTVPQFGEYYYVQDPVAERQCYDRLAAFRRGTGRSLSIAYSFDMTLLTVDKPEGRRKLPSFAHNGGDYKLVVTKVVQPFMESEAH